ncbi:phosphoribosyltransferase [Pseudomonas granadensis]|uniref:Phosphoribosyltransferase n=1 Tax=Pseudomonas granadensis TaxID=1421430 RepID=A0ABX7GDC3_9PSED|nr:phosphoribosyltransferase [Pseudomonas granadensis]MBN6773805.1 phosphoribosyltransferase [Pseudomonas granadensis]MBN6804204.1 phosphoribosyltransferase [Pseudomonas granadensis]MBN6831350.1 phosphoribosyltransferase [Pseudomonas granadensis]MBN6838879.1 phosphoribosyltransferase [Pseudomonas granadensis]MBN6868505.1 phosphoribosyltransferase [Pseudomonas granadensis]
MLALITSPSAIIVKGQPDAKIIQALINSSAQGNAVGVVSNHVKPDWFDAAFSGSKVIFLKAEARQNGAVITEIAKKLNMPNYDILVLAVNTVDMQMAKNGRAVLIAADWASDAAVRGLGIKISSPQELQDLITMTNGWNGHWWYEGQEKNYSVKALVDLSGYGKELTQQLFASKLTTTVKNGGSRLTALLIVTARSLLIDGVDNAQQLFWGVYPSSKSANDDSEVLSEFTHRLRTTASRVRLAKVGEPLFIRHTASEKRSANKNANRTDPTGQITTIHLNPNYKAQIKGRNVIVIDDCTTYGISFAVASAFLLAAGALSVNGVALGKFGNQMGYYEIILSSDPFKPIAEGQFTVTKQTAFNGKTDGTAQKVLQALIP